MLEIGIVCAVIFGLLIVSDLLFRKKLIDSEVSRKLVHMGSGLIIAFSPYYLTWTQLQILSVMLLVVVWAVSRYKLFRSISTVKRSTKGEILFAVGIVICAFIEPANWIFVAAILHLAIADALAAVVGIKWGKRTAYTILSHGKSMLGSLTFFYMSMAIMFYAYLYVHPANFPDLFMALVVVPAVLTVIENISWYGLDNVTVPVSVILILSYMQ